MSRSLNPVPQFFDNSGNILAEGEVFYYFDNTTTPKTTYSDVNLTEENPFPIVLDDEGRIPDVFFDGLARQLVKDKNGVQITERTASGTPATVNALDDYSSQNVYAENDLVTDDSGDYYRSLQDFNQNNEPSLSPAFWVQVEMIEHWNTNADYPTGATVKTSDGKLWIGLDSPNIGNDPLLTGAWEGIQFDAVASVEFNVIINGYGVTSVQDVSGDTLVTFDKSASAASQQAILVVNNEKLYLTYTDPTNFTVNSALVQSEFQNGGGAQPTRKFTIFRISG